MTDKLSREDEFLLKEYDSAVKLTFHVDEMRSKFTNLFITIAGAAAAAISLLIQGDATNTTFGNFEALLVIFLLLLALTGILVIMVIAKLRRVQLEHFRITNNVRRHFLRSSYSLWNVVELSDQTLPSPNRKSGTYFWTLILILLNSYVVALSIYLLCGSWLIALIGWLFFIVLQDILYFRLAILPKTREYSKKSPPDGDS
jgi:uncharacterized integral membrane protein